MDEWYIDGKEAPPTNPLSFEKADRDLCFSRIRKDLVMPDSNLHFPQRRHKLLSEKLGGRESVAP